MLPLPSYYYVWGMRQPMAQTEKKEYRMTNEVKEKEKPQVAEEKMVWHKPANLGIPSVIYQEDLASVRIADLPLPEEILATTTVQLVGEYFEFLRDTSSNIPEAVVINPSPLDTTADPIASGIARRMQWLTAAIDLCTGRYQTATFKEHEVLFDRNLAIATHVKMTFRNGRWTAWDWYSALGMYQPRATALPQKMLDKHNSITAILTGQRIYVPFGLDKGLFDWFEEILEMELGDWLTNRDEAFGKLRTMQNAYTAATNPMFRHKHDVQVGDFKGTDGAIYLLIDVNGKEHGERTYNSEKDWVVDQFNILAGQGFTFSKVSK